jgi:hypothetical protein
MKQILYIIIIAALTIIYSCVDSDSIIDAVRGNIGDLKRDTLMATESIFIEHGKVSTGFSSKLLLGNFNNFECRYLVKFSTLPNDSIDLDSVYFLIQPSTNIGETDQDITGEIKLVTKDWDEAVNTDEDWSYIDDVSNSPLTTTTINISSEDSSLYTITIPDTIISIWQDTTNGDQNHGLLIDYNNADFVKIFLSINSGISPKLVYVYQNSTNDSTIRDTVFASVDASIIEYTGDLQSDSLLYITSGYSHRAFIKFELESLPKDILISNVNFILHQDTSFSLTDKTSSNNLYLRTVTSPFTSLPFYEVDSTFLFNLDYNISLSGDITNQLKISADQQGKTGQYFIQSIIDENIKYDSFLLHFVGEGNTISQLAIKGANQNIIVNKRPKMIVEYLKIPKSRI